MVDEARGVAVRLFYAIFPPHHLQQELAQLQEPLKAYRGWKPVLPAHLHLTLLFLGEVPPEALEEVRAAGERVAGSTSPLKLHLGGTGYFPPQGTPRVWYLKVTGEGLEELALRLRRELHREDPFQPHLTLARRKAPAPRLPPVRLNREFAVREISLVHSELSEKGPAYRVLYRFALKGKLI